MDGPVKPPENADAERAVLGAALTRWEAVQRLVGGLRPDHFYRPAHGRIWTEILALARQGDPIDPVTVAAALGDDLKRIGGPVYLVGLMESVTSLDSAGYHAGMILEAAQRRTVMEVGQRLTQQAGTGALGVLMAEAVRELRLVEESDTGDIETWPLEAMLLEPDEEPEWLIPGCLERGDRFVLTGQEGGGKSTLIRQVSVMGAAGLHPFTGAKARPFTVAIFDVENTRRQATRAFRPLAIQAQRFGQPDWRGRVFVDFRTRLDPANTADLAYIHRVMDAVQPDLVTLGPLVRMVGRSLSSDDDAVPVLAALDTIRDRGAAIILEAHAGHVQRKDGERDWRPRGSSALLGWPEYGMGLANDAETGHGLLKRWRGDRERRAWPIRLRSGGLWPWTPADTTDNPEEYRSRPEPIQEELA